MRCLYVWGSSSCLILISNEPCISHKLFAQYVSRLLQSFKLDSFADGGLSPGPSVPTRISSTLAAEQKTGYSRHVKQWRGHWDHFRVSFREQHSFKTQSEYLWWGWCPHLCLNVFVSQCDFSIHFPFLLLFFVITKNQREKNLATIFPFPSLCKRSLRIVH